MHFVIDALGINKVGGGRTSVLLQLRSLFQIDTDNTYTVVLNSLEEGFANFRNVEQRILRVPNRFAAHFAAQFIIPMVARSRKAALVHHTKHLGSLFNSCPYILTINDMTTLRLPWAQSWVDLAYWKTVQRFIVSRAALILAPSEDASSDIDHYYGIGRSRIRLVPYAPSAIFRPDGDKRADSAVRERYGVRDGYVLFVGIQALKKNLPTLVRAFQLLKHEGRYEGTLVIVGREYPQSSQRGLGDLVLELGLEKDMVFTGPVPDEHLPAFYRGADVFAFPSLHEGFGIVVLEAMACGVPVVASHASSLPEVVDDAGILVKDLLDAKSWAEALRQVLFDSDLRKALIGKGLVRASDYSWEKVGHATLDCYVAAARQS